MRGSLKSCRSDRWPPSRIVPLRIAVTILFAASLAQYAEVALAEGTDDPVQIAQQVPLPPTNPAPAPNPYARFDALSEKGWAIPFPHVGDTIVGDAGGMRSKLADNGIGIFALSLNNFSANMLSGDHGGTQVYMGQKPTVTSFNEILMSYDLSHIGIKNGQLNFGVLNEMVTWEPMGPRQPIGLARLNYYQSFLDDRVQMKIGYLLNDVEYVGLFVGGSFANGTLGPNGIIPFEVGLSRAPMPTPGINVKTEFNGFYNKFGIQRSVSPDGAQAEHDANPSGFRFSTPGARALFIDEVGYQLHAGHADRAVWLRAGGIYNTSQYTNFEHGGKTSDNYAVYAAGDYQLSHPGNSPTYRGIYTGLSFNYAPPDRNAISQYYEARVYAIGVFPSRPADMISFIYSHSQFSQFVRADVALEGLTSVAGSNSVTAAYVYHVAKGVYANAGVSYVDKPALAPAKKNALLGLVSLNLLF